MTVFALRGMEFFSATLALLTIALVAHGAPSDKTVTAGRVGQAIGRFVAKAEKSARFSGAVLAARNGKVVAAVGAGSTGEANPRPIDTTTLFEIASATKPFTAIAILQLQEKGKLALDDSISKLLHEVPENCREITIRHLLQHTSGIPGTNYQAQGDDFSAIVGPFLEGGPRHTPGTHYEYWNQGYSLLSEIIARASGKSYVDYCKEKIFAPAGMKSTCFTGDEAPPGVAVAIGQSTRGAPRSALEHPYGETYGYEYRGMGGLVTNVWDLWRWDRALKAGKLLTPESLEEMSTPGPGGYALGWQTATRPGAPQAHSHGGSVRGFTCQIMRYPDEDACLFILTNSDNSTPLGLVTKGCEELLFDQKLTVKFPVGLSDKQLSSIVGEYFAAPNRVLKIVRSGKVAKTTIDWGGPMSYATISVDGEGNFSYVDPRDVYDLGVEFDDEGKAKSIKMLDMTFERR